jgi:hypothetical protein
MGHNSKIADNTPLIPFNMLQVKIVFKSFGFEARRNATSARARLVSSPLAPPQVVRMSQSSQAVCVAVCVVSLWNPMHVLTHFIVGEKYAIQGPMKPSMSDKAMSDENAEIHLQEYVSFQFG